MRQTTSGRLLKRMPKFRGYSVVKLIGVGANSEVWLVRHDLLFTEFAVKVTPKAVMDADPDLRSQFAVEARISGKVRHPALVSVYDAGLDEKTGLYFLVMDYMPGGTIASRLLVERRFSVRKAASIARTVAKGLVELKRLGVVHRDVKPMNMLVAANGDVRLGDFGISLFSDSPPEDERDDLVVGTPLYLSREQIADSRAVDSRADVYSLGVSLFEMLAGKCPGTEMTTDELLRKRLDGDRLPDIRTVNKAIPENVARLIYRMTDPDADKRLGSPEAVVKELDAILGKARSASGAGRRLRALIAASVAGLIAVLALAVVYAPKWIGDAVVDHGGDSEETSRAEPPPLKPVSPTPFHHDRTGGASMVTNTVVVTNFVVVATNAAHVATATADVATNTQLRLTRGLAPDGDTQFATTNTPSVVSNPVPEAAAEVEVCGIRIDWKAQSDEQDKIDEMTECIHLLSGYIEVADRAMRGLMPFWRTEKVQTGVVRITLVEGCDAPKGYRYKKGEKALEIDIQLVRINKQIAELVSSFMSARRGEAEPRGPYAQELGAYIRYRVCDEIARHMRSRFGKSHCSSEISGAIAEADYLDRSYGVCRPNGILRRYGVEECRIPSDMRDRYRKGKVFWVLYSAEGINGSAIRNYFIQKEREIKRGVFRSGRMNESDFVAILSRAVGKNIFKAVRREGWDVSRSWSRVDVDRLEKVDEFDICR